MVTLMDLTKSALRTMRVMPDVIKDAHVKLYKSETPLAILYWLDDKEKAKVAELEADGNKVWHVIKSNARFDEEEVALTTYLVFTHEDVEVFERAEAELLGDIGKNSLTWQEKAAFMRVRMSKHLQDGICFSYTENETWPDCSEYGGVLIMPRHGGIVRIG